MRGLPATVWFLQTGTLPTAPLRAAKYLTASLAQVQEVAGLSTEWMVCGNGHCSCNNNTPVTCSENMFNQSDFSEGENTCATSVPDTR